MKSMMFLGGFVLYAVLATFVSKWLMQLFLPTRSSYGEAVFWLLALFIGLVFGFVGMCSGYYVYKKDYGGAAAISVVLTFAIAIAAATVFSMH